MFKITDSNGIPLAEHTGPENAIAWLEGQGETFTSALEILSKVREGVIVRSGAITVETI